MNIKKYLLFLILLVSACNVAWSQTPTHFKIGEKTFANIDIYSILQTNDGTLYAATSDGIYIKKCNTFNRIEAIKEQKGNSFFGLKANSKEEVFCHNLKGQIFKIIGEKNQLYYETAKDEQVNYPEFFFDENDEMIIFGKNLFKLNKNLEKEIIINNKIESSQRAAFYRPMQMMDGTIVSSYSLGEVKKYIVYKNSKIEIYSYDNINWIDKGSAISGSLSGFRIKNSPVFITEFNHFSGPYKVSMISNSRRKIHQLSDELLFSYDSKKGMNFWELKNNTLTQNKTIFPNTSISAYHYNKDGALLLGTFGEGIIVIPNFKTLEVDLNSSLRGIDAFDNKAIITSRDGIIYEYESELKKIAERKLNLDDIFILKKNYSFLQEPNIVSSFGSIDNLPIIKDLAEADSGFFMATNDGILYASENINNNEIKLFSNTSKKINNKNVVTVYGNSRYSSLVYANELKELYFTNFNKIEYLSGNNIEELLNEGESIFCSDLAYHDKKIIVSTPEKGVLFFENHSLKFKLDINSGLSSNKIEKLKLIGDWLYILSDNSLQVYDIKQDKLAYVNSENGVVDNLILNFSADKNNLWLLKSKSFIKIPTNSISFEKQNLTYSLDSILSSSRNIKNITSFNLDPEEDNFSIYINFNDLVKSRDATFQVKLDNEKWTSYPATTNKIDIQNYDNGKHTLQIRLKYGNNTYDLKKIDFKLNPPFYNSWWFLPLLLLSIGGIIVLFFRRKIRLQAKEARRENELNSSKLKSIQSQMNPHFIFNALNSIQYLVIKGDSDSAYNYITRFANLIRRTLDYSEKETISIVKEIELLEFYLGLEKLRFQEDFDYEIIKKNIKEVQVPPMLIQPFIENALIHGLLHKSGHKQLTMKIEVLDNHIICTIDDNGIGRMEAKKIRTRQKGDHESFAVNAINNRFNILNENNEQKLGYEYIDFPPGEGEVTTRVIIKIPTI